MEMTRHHDLGPTPLALCSGREPDRKVGYHPEELSYPVNHRLRISFNGDQLSDTWLSSIDPGLDQRSPRLDIGAADDPFRRQQPILNNGLVHQPLQASQNLPNQSSNLEKTSSHNLYPIYEVAGAPKARAHESEQLSSRAQRPRGSSLMSPKAGLSATGWPGDSRSSRERRRGWINFAALHRKVLDTRVKAEEMRKTFSDRRKALMEAHDVLFRLLEDLQEGALRASLPDRFLKQFYTVREAGEALDLAESQLKKWDKELVQEEHVLYESLPEILRNDKDTEETFAMLKVRGFDFRGEDSRSPDSATDTTDHIVTSDLDPEAKVIISRLDAINVLEADILSLRDSKALLQHEVLTDSGTDVKAHIKALEELDQYDLREQATIKELRAAVASLEQLRKNDPDPLERYRDADPVSANSAVNIGDLPAEVRGSQEVIQSDASRLFWSSRKRLRSQPMQQLPVFPGLFDPSSGQAEKIDQINSWLFHQLRTSDAELWEYVRCLLRVLDISKGLTPNKVLDYALREWHRDAVSKTSWSQQQRNTTNATNLGGSRLQVSNTASFSYQLGRPRNLYDGQALPNLNNRNPPASPLQDDISLSDFM